MSELTTIAGLLKHSATIMEKLEQRKIDVDVAKAQASLLKQSNNLMRLDLDERKFKDKLQTRETTIQL